MVMGKPQAVTGSIPEIARRQICCRCFRLIVEFVDRRVCLRTVCASSTLPLSYYFLKRKEEKPCVIFHEVATSVF